MFWKQYAISILLVFTYSCTHTTYWTTNVLLPIPETPIAEEIHITDSTFIEYNHTFEGCLIDNSGLCIIRKCEAKGDTIFVYNVGYSRHPNDSANSTIDKQVVETYFRKGRKLYPIYDVYPDFKSYFYFLGDSTTEIDTSNIISFSVDWQGWRGDSAYIDFNGEYHKQGKYKALRKVIHTRMERNDTIIWHNYEPREIINDTTFKSLESNDKLGPLKSY